MEAVGWQLFTSSPDATASAAACLQSVWWQIPQYMLIGEGVQFERVARKGHLCLPKEGPSSAWLVVLAPNSPAHPVPFAGCSEVFSMVGAYDLFYSQASLSFLWAGSRGQPLLAL